ncbi:DNA processing protein DprA [Paenibacillus sp. J2TS4]|nr:DNA processing protein DprA [Paenibacillus sp. J2TS4]
MKNRYILLALHEMEGIGWQTIVKLIGQTESLDELLHWSTADWVRTGVREDRAQIIRNGLTPDRIQSRLEFYDKTQVQIVTIYDETYPYRLRHISRPPWVLYTKGDLKLLDANPFAIVGTRTPTAYGRKAASELALRLSEAGFCIVSGLARGIDSSAHLGALQGRAKTIAVLGTSIDKIYPPENRTLYRQIEEQGLLISEFSPGTVSHPGLFPLRNRIIAGISLGTLVVEAAGKSGSLITADQALNESRDLFAVPGPISSPKSSGTNLLIQNGAKLVTCAEDIIEEYKGRITHQTYTGSPSEDKDEPDLTEEEREILDFISFEPTTIDYLLEQTQTNFGHLHTILLSLSMKKKIAQRAGSAYVLL